MGKGSGWQFFETSASLSDARLVGQALKFVQAPDIPWQRVIGANGHVSDRGDGGEGAAAQAERLRQGERKNGCVAHTLDGLFSHQRGWRWWGAVHRYGTASISGDMAGVCMVVRKIEASMLTEPPFLSFPVPERVYLGEIDEEPDEEA